VNANLIPSILLDYIPPLASAVSCDNVLRDFDYTLITVHLSKGIHAVGLQLGKIMTLNISEFNLGDRMKNGMLAPHKFHPPGEEVQDHPPVMDYGHREVHYSERDEDTTLWKESGG
jgi:hypothetical protein